MDPDVRLLRYFLVLAEELNFTRAAERLHIAQPSLSAQIRQLEAQLGVRLLHRSTRSVSLTEAGEALRARGPGALNAMARAWQAARDTGRGVTGQLRMAHTLSAAHDTVPQLLEAVHAAYQGITVSTDVLATPQVLIAVRDGRAQLGVARAPAPMDGVRLQPLRHDVVGVLVASSHPLANAETVDLRNVASHPVVLHPRSANPSHHDFVRDVFASRGLDATFLERDIAFDLSQRFITEGAAVALVGRSIAARLPRELRWIPLTDHVVVPVVLVLPRREQSETSRLFESVALAHAAAHGWLA